MIDLFDVRGVARAAKWLALPATTVLSALAFTAPASATGSGVDQTCASLAATPYVEDINNLQFNVTLADGDTLMVTGTGTLEYFEPGGGGNQSTSFPATFVANSTNAGVWAILRSVTTGNTTLTCTLAGSTTSTSESSNLDQQQIAFSSTSILHTAYTMIDGATQTGGPGGPGTANLLSQDGFFISSRNLMARNLERTSHLLGYKDGAPASEASDWNFWVKGRYTSFDGSGNSFDGHVADIFVGVDKRVSDNATIGVLAGYSDSGFDTLVAGTSGNFDSDGGSIGVYTNLNLGGSVHFSALIAYSALDYENRSGATAGTFDADRVTISAKLSGQIEMDKVTVMPVLSLLYASEDQGAYVDSASVLHVARNIDAFRVSVGPKILFAEQATSNGSYQFWVGASAEFDDSDNGATPASGIPDIGNSTSARLSAGLNTHANGGGGLKLRGDVSGLGSGDYTAIGGSAAYRLPF